MKGIRGKNITITLALALLVSTSTIVVAVGGGDSLVVADDPLDAAYRHQPLPGELDLDDLEMTLVWKAKGKNITTSILLEDLDRDGLMEVVFGMDNGRVKAIEVANNETVLDIRLTEKAIEALVVGNVDGDKDDEIVLASTEGIYCYDFKKEEKRWNESFEVLDAELHLVEAATDDRDGPTKHDVIVLWSDSSYYLGAKHHVARYDGKGERLWATALSSLLGGNGPFASGLVLDADGSQVLFVNDHGETDIGFGGSSRNIWLLDTVSGRVEKSMSVGRTELRSSPIPVLVNGSTRVAIGLRHGGSASEPDLLLYDIETGRHDLMDVSNSTWYIDWTFLAFAHDGPDGTVVMSKGWYIHSFVLSNPGINGTHPSSSSGHDSPHILCDIDGDGTLEILAPGGGIWILDSESMQYEAQITQYREGGGVASRATAIRLTVGDIDRDKRSEVVFGYYDDTGTRTFYIFYLGSLDLPGEEPISTGIAVGWGIIAFVVGANILLIAILVRDWRGKGEPED